MKTEPSGIKVAVEWYSLSKDSNLQHDSGGPPQAMSPDAPVDGRLGQIGIKAGSSGLRSVVVGWAGDGVASVRLKTTR